VTLDDSGLLPEGWIVSSPFGLLAMTTGFVIASEAKQSIFEIEPQIARRFLMLLL
jgi:hypothetical protein